MAKTSSAASTKYHYAQQAENRETVRTQGKAINTALKKLKKISSKEFLVPELPVRKDEPTQQHVTIPNGKSVDLRLKKALEDAVEQCRKSEAPPTIARARPKRKPWFGWID